MSKTFKANKNQIVTEKIQKLLFITGFTGIFKKSCIDN